MFALIRSFEGLDYYGDIPEIPDPLDERIEIYPFKTGDREKLSLDFADSINRLCDSDLDIGDVDYFNECKCRKILKWLSDRKNKGIKDPRLRELYEELHKYALEAVRLHTGVIIEL